MRDLPQIIDYDKNQLSYALANALKERDEAREELRTAVQERHDFHWELLDAIRERDELRKELEEYRSIAENIGAEKAVSEKEKAIHERDEAREKLSATWQSLRDLQDEVLRLTFENRELRNLINE